MDSHCQNSRRSAVASFARFEQGDYFVVGGIRSAGAAVVADTEDQLQSSVLAVAEVAVPMPLAAGSFR